MTEKLERAMPTYSETKSFEELTVIYCPPPNTTLARTLTEHNISVSSLRTLRMKTDRDLVSSELDGLPIENLQLKSFWSVRIFNLAALVPLTNLKTLFVKGGDSQNAILTLPLQLELVEVTLENGAATGRWGSCRLLEQLTLTQWDVTSVASKWLANCQALKSLTISDSNPENVDKVLDGVTIVKNLAIRNSKLTVLPNQLLEMTNLEKLDLSTNKITDLSSQWLVTLKPSVKEVNMQYNLLHHCDQIYTLIEHMPGLLKLSVASNPFLDVCQCVTDDPNFAESEGRNAVTETFVASSLKSFHAWNTVTSRLCFGKFKLDALEEFVLSFTKIDSLKFKDLPKPAKPLRKIDLKGNSIQEVTLEQTEHGNLPSELLDLSFNNITRISGDVAAALFNGGSRHLRLYKNPFECDCAARPLLRTLRRFRTQVEDYDQITCGNNERALSEVDANELCNEPLASGRGTSQGQ